MKAQEMRETFINYLLKRGHKEIPSASTRVSYSQRQECIR